MRPAPPRPTSPQLLANWLHGHALDESAINYDGISLVRLVKFLELMPGGPEDMGSDAFKQFVYEFADAITPAGCATTSTSAAARPAMVAAMCNRLPTPSVRGQPAVAPEARRSGGFDASNPLIRRQHCGRASMKAAVC